ncbi:MAG: hypothetical protein KDD62_06055 [Bdellovibrionales bacterium]|nr:hypothetical protein [Bdellovibrionales bacterium]
MQISDSQRTGLGIEFQQVTSLIPLPRFYLMVALDSLWLRPRYLSLMTSQPAYHLHSKAYGGELSIDAATSWQGMNGTADLEVKDLQLNAHKQIEGLGVHSGALSIKASEILWGPQRLESVKFAEVNIKSLSIPEGIVIPKGTFGLLIELKVPALTNANASAVIDFKQPQLSVSDISFKSNWGQLSGSVKLEMNSRNQLVATFIALDVELDPETKDYFGPIFQVNGGGKITPETTKVKIRKDGLNARLQFLPG